MDFYVVESSYYQYVNVKKLEELFCYWLCNDSVVCRKNLFGCTFICI